MASRKKLFPKLLVFLAFFLIGYFLYQFFFVKEGFFAKPNPNAGFRPPGPANLSPERKLYEECLKKFSKSFCNRQQFTICSPSDIAAGKCKH
jgi:hypothetical protein